MTGYIAGSVLSLTCYWCGNGFSWTCPAEGADIPFYCCFAHKRLAKRRRAYGSKPCPRPDKFKYGEVEAQALAKKLKDSTDDYVVAYRCQCLAFHVGKPKAALIKGEE